MWRHSAYYKSVARRYTAGGENKMTQVKLNGTEYTLTQDAYYNNGSGNEYQASATDKLGNEYMIYWTIIGDENAEESDMCDWDNPVRAELISSRDMRDRTVGGFGSTFTNDCYIERNDDNTYTIYTGSESASYPTEREAVEEWERLLDEWSDGQYSRDLQKDAFSALLDKKGISSVAELARIAGLPRKTVDDLCSGRTDLDRATFGTISSICEALGISMMDLDQIISGYKQPSGRYSVETVEVDKGGHICDGLDTVYFDTMDKAQEYYNSRQAQKGHGWVLYELGEVKDQKGIN